MRRARSNFRPQVNIPKAKKPKKEEVADNVTPPAAGQPCPPAVDVTPSSDAELPTKDGTNGGEQSVSTEKEVPPLSPVKPVPPTSIARVSPEPPVESSSSEDEGVIDPYDPNNPQGTRIERERGIFRKTQRFQKTFTGGKPTSMIDYLFYNPKGTPMLHSQTKKLALTSCRDEEEEEMEDDPEAVEEEPAQPKFAPTVQLKIGPDGTFQLDEKSLVRETTEARQGREKLSKSSIASSLNYSSPNRGRATRIKWTSQETIFFYKCLATLGSDFEMISKYFPGRTRHHIKLKFKLEERTNPTLINQAFAGGNFDVTELQDQYQAVAEKAKEERKRKKAGAKGSKGHKRKRKVSEDEEDKGMSTSSVDSDVEEELRVEMEADRKPRKEELHILHIKREAKQARDARLLEEKKAQAAVVTTPPVSQPNQPPASDVSPRNPVIRQILSTGLHSKTPAPLLPSKAPAPLLSTSAVPDSPINPPTHPIPVNDSHVVSAVTVKESPEKLVQLMRIDSKAVAAAREQGRPSQFALVKNSNSMSIVTNNVSEFDKEPETNRTEVLTKVTQPNIVYNEESSSAQNVDLPENSTASDTLNPDNSENVDADVDEVESEEEPASDDENSTDSETMELDFLSKSPQPTRSGRIPKHNKPMEEPPAPVVRKRTVTRKNVQPKAGKNTKRAKKPQAIAPMVVHPINPPSPVPSDADSSIADGQEMIALPPDVDPSSLLILKTSDPGDPEKVLYKIFMISPNCGGTTVIHNPDGTVQAVTAATDNTRHAANVATVSVEPADSSPTSATAVPSVASPEPSAS